MDCIRTQTVLIRTADDILQIDDASKCKLVRMASRHLNPISL